MAWSNIVVLAVIQGLAELLPVSSSAHVIAAEKLMGLDPSSPEMTFLLVMLHTGTMGAVLLYFWPRWKERFLASAPEARIRTAKSLLIATVLTGVVGLGLKIAIERVWLRGQPRQEVESLFANLPLMAAALFATGCVILWASYHESASTNETSVGTRQAAWIGFIQGVCLPFRGFSRSGATISMGLRCGMSRALSEDFSFALAVLLTPPVLLKEAHRLSKASAAAPTGLFQNGSPFIPGLVGMIFSFLAGLVALRLLSRWLEAGKWRYFGYYCLAASAGVLALSRTVP